MGRDRLGGGGVFRAALVVAGGCALLAGCSSGSSPTTGAARTGGVTGKAGYLVYWDQNEEVDFLSQPSGIQGQLLPAWDLNGQMCVVPDRSGRFVGGLDPTLPSQHNPGGLKPYKQPAIGEELDRADGSFSGQVLYVPGPYKMPGQSVGEDSPSTNGAFNNNSTYTGCAFDKKGDLFATDIGTAQGSFPPPDDGRLVEWFAPSYRSYCIVEGPTAGGVGPHHVDGTGGLGQPGMLALADNGDLLMPEAGPDQVIRIDHTSFPPDAAACPGGVYPSADLRTSVFFQGSSTQLPFPAGIARDPTCGCYAISSFFGNPSIIWVTADGKPEPGRQPVPGETLAQLGQNPDGYNPFGLAFAPDGTLYFVDIHITCKDNQIGNGCGPADYGGRVMKVDVQRRPPVDTHSDPRRLRLPHQRHRLRPRPSGVSVSDGQDRGTGVGTVGERRPGPGTGVGQAGHGRVRVGGGCHRIPGGAADDREIPHGRVGLRVMATVAARGVLAGCSAGAASPGAAAHDHAPGPWDWLDLRPRRPAHLPRPHHADRGRQAPSPRWPGSSRPATPSRPPPRWLAAPSTSGRGTTISMRSS